MLTVGTGVGQSMHIYGLDNTILICSHTDCDLHLMAWRRTDHGFVSGENDLGRTACLPGYNSRINITDGGLLCSKASSDSGLDHTHLRCRNIQCPAHDPAHMEGNLSRRKNCKSAKMIHVAGCAEGLHHSLLVCFCMIGLFYCIFTFRQHFIYISLFLNSQGTEVSFIVSSQRDFQFPVILRMNQNSIILCLVNIQNRSLYFIFYFNSL